MWLIRWVKLAPSSGGGGRGKEWKWKGKKMERKSVWTNVLSEVETRITSCPYLVLIKWCHPQIQYIEKFDVLLGKKKNLIFWSNPISLLLENDSRILKSDLEILSFFNKFSVAWKLFLFFWTPFLNSSSLLVCILAEGEKERQGADVWLAQGEQVLVLWRWQCSGEGRDPLPILTIPGTAVTSRAGTLRSAQMLS